MKKDKLIVALIVGLWALVMGTFFGKIFRLDVRAIPAKYSSEEEKLLFEGKTYHLIEMNDDSYSFNPDLELLGRAKGSTLLLYSYKNDSDKSIIMGDSLDIGYIFSDRYSTIPEEGEVTSVYVELADWHRTEAGSSYTLVKKENLMDVAEVELFKRLWKERHKNEPIVYKNSQVLSEMDYVWVRFCFEECPAPGASNRLVLHNEEWYLIETEYEYVDNLHIQTDYCYLIDDEEILEYLSEFVEISLSVRYNDGRILQKTEDKL